MKSNYKIGESYLFRIKNVFANYCELIDEERGVRAYLQNTENLRLSKSQTIKCRILSTKERHPRVELVDLTDIIVRDNANINEAVLAKVLSEQPINWNVRDFIKLMLSEESTLSFTQQCQRWIQQQININSNLEDIRHDCENILEYSPLLDLGSQGERELYQSRFTTLIEQLSYYIRAQKFIAMEDEENNAHKFVNEILQKLRQSGFVYHPMKKFSIMSSMFLLQPSLMDEYMPKLYAVIRSRNLSLWRKEPFRTALIRVLELYVSNGSNRIDQTKNNGELILHTITGLAIQLLLLEGHDDGGIVDYRRAAARICTIASYARLPNNIDILSLALCNLLSQKVQLPSYNLFATKHQAFPFFVSNTAKNGDLTIDTTNIFTRNHIKLTVSRNGIALSATEGRGKLVPMLPKELNLWQNMQVYVPKMLTGVVFLGTRDIFKYQRLWDEIESEMFNISQNSTSNTSRRKHKVMETVRISVLRQDSQNHDKFYCRIEDEIGGEGYIMLSDIVAYTAAISVRQFLSDKGNRLVFNAVIIENDDDMFRFSMEEDLKQFAQTFYKDEPDGIVCSIGSDKSADGKHIPGVTQEGVSVSLVAQDGLTRLKRNDLVVATYLGEGFGTFHIEAAINGMSDNNNEFSITEAFHYLMQEYAIDQIEDTSSVSARDILDSDNIMNVAEVHELIYMIDRISILDNEYIKSYNYLAFARLLSLMTGMENKAAYYKGRMDIILMLHDFAVNDRVNEQNLEQLSSANADLFSGNPILRDRFNQLQTVSFIGKPEKNDQLWQATASDDPIVSELAQLVLSYNFVKQNNMNSQAIDIHNRIKATLRLKGHETNLKLYGGGIEDKTTEYKTSIVFVADKTVDKANPQEQMKEILKVINSFLNTEGGTLYIGVNDSGMGVGLENDLEYKDFHGDRDAYQRCIISAVVRTWGTVVGTYVDIAFDQDNTKAVCIVSVRPYANGIPFEGAWYVREVSTKRAMTLEEFSYYNANSRQLPQHVAQAEPVVIEKEEETEPVAEPEYIEPEEMPQEETKEAETPEWKPEVTSNGIPTSVIRKNVLFEDGSDDYRPSIAFLQFLDYAKFCKISDYNWDDKLLTLAVYDEEQEGFLVIAYADGHFAKVRIDELLDYNDNQSYARYGGSNVIFASIAKPGDAVICVSREDSRQRRAMLRIDSIANIPECKLADYGNRIYNENMASEILQVDIIPAAHLDGLDDLINQDRRSLGKPTKTTKPEYRSKLEALNITLAE